MDSRRHETADRMRDMPGLAYASLTDDPLVPMLVCFNSEPVGEIHKDVPGAVLNWHARAYNAGGLLPAARIAADSLVWRGGEL